MAKVIDVGAAVLSENDRLREENARLKNEVEVYRKNAVAYQEYDKVKRERDEARAEVERSHKAILALTGEVERLRAQWDVGVRAGMTATAEQQGRILALEAEVERQVADYGRLRGEMLAAVAEKWRALKALVEAGDLIATWCPSDHRGVWAEAKRKAGL